MPENEVKLQKIIEVIKSGQDTGHPVEIYLPENASPPPPIERVLKNIDAGLHPLIEVVYQFFDTPIVEDHFGSDDQRRDLWEKQIEKLYGQTGLELVQKNRLRPNSFTNAVSVLVALPDYLDRPDLNHIKDKIDQRALNPDQYKRLPTEEKIKIVAGIHEAAVELMKSFDQ